MSNTFRGALVLLLLFFGIGGFYLSQSYQERPYLTILGYLKMADGLGRQSIELINALKDDVPIRFIRTQIDDFRDVPESVKNVLKQRLRNLGRVVIYEDTVHMAHHYRSVLQDESQIRIAYSMFESSRIPQRWVDNLNRYFDAVIVPDEFLVSVYEESGVKLPIFVVPLGLELDGFLNAPLKTSVKRPFVFANLSTCLDRKNQLKLIQAFAKTYGNNPDFHLIINARYVDPCIKEALEKEIASLTNVQFTTRCLSNADYLQLFQEVDCYVSLSKGEGFSIQPREAMALAIPVIATDNTGQSTICRSNLVRIVPSPIALPATYDWSKERVHGNNYDCTLEDAADALRDVYEHYDAYLQNATSSREWVRQYEYKNLKGYYHSLVKPKHVILGDKNTISHEGIMTNSEHLYQKYLKLIE